MTGQEEPKANQPDSRDKETAKKIGWGLFAVFGSGLALWLILPTVAVLLIVVAITTRSCVRSCIAPQVSIPPIHGRVIDAATGQGLQGARVMRIFYHEAEVDFESRSPYPMKDTLASETTDASGRFTLPGTETVSGKGVRGLSGMAWVVWKPGWMPAFDCYFEDTWAPDGCRPFRGMQDLDPWVETSFQSGGGEFRMEVRIFPPTQPGIKRKEHDAAGRVVLSDRVYLGPNGKPEPPDPWVQYFSRINRLVRDSFIPVDDLVNEAVAYAKTHDLNWSVLTQFALARGSLGFKKDDGSYYKPEQALRLLQIEEQYCQGHPEDTQCDGPRLQQWRNIYTTEVRANQR